MIKKWTSPNHPGRENRHINCDGIEFVAMPHQAYYSEKRNGFYAIVSFGRKRLDGLLWAWLIRIMKGDEEVHREHRELEAHAFETATEILKKISQK